MEIGMRQGNPGWQIGFIMSSPGILARTNLGHVRNSAQNGIFQFLHSRSLFFFIFSSSLIFF